MLWLIEDVEHIALSEVSPLFPLLSAERRERVQAIHHEPAAVRSALAELLLRLALRVELGLTDLPRIEIGKKGKPFFPDLPEIQFNLSHCRTAVACVLDTAPVGVDVQEVRRNRREDAPPYLPLVFRILSEKELTWVTASESSDEQDRRFTAVWTCKEAYGKADGNGVLYDLKQTEFLPCPGVWEQYGRRFYHSKTDDLYLTVCTALSDKEVVQHALRFSDLIRFCSDDGTILNHCEV